MNLEFLVVALIVARAIDWIFQSQYQAENKTINKWILLEHSIYYSIPTVFVMVMLGIIAPGIVAGSIWFVLLVSHMIIDDRRVVKCIMYLKGLSWEQLNSKEYGWLQIGIDQILHDVIILAIAVMI